LDALNASAYIAEPGASAQFYGNISLSHWFLSERPLLLIISPKVDGEDIQPMVSVLTPQFEATRAKMLPIPASPIQFVEWAEDANPYNITALVLPEDGTIFVDGSIRNFIVEGLQKALPKFKVSFAPEKITQLRECKSPAELEFLKCANEVVSY
jgi:Xaa-Pro aminopeptidase